MAANTSTKGRSGSKSSGSVSTTKNDDKEPEFTVVSADGRRTHFRGTETDAQQYVQRNFPHVHVEPGTDYGDEGPQPDVFVRDPKGNLSGWVAGDWVEYKD